MKRTPLQKLLVLKMFSGGTEAPTEEKTATGNPASFSTDVEKALTDLTIAFTDANGATGMNIWHSGKNLANVTIEQGTINGSTGEDSPDNSRIRTKEFIFIKAGNYSISASGVGQVVWCRYDKAKTFVTSNGFYDLPKKFSMAADGYVRFIFRKSSNNERVYPEDISNVQLEIGDASAYEAYHGETYPVTWTDAVTAGSFDAVTGVLTETAPESKTVELDPVSIQTFNGDNVIQTDTSGTNTVKYLKKVTT